MAGKQRDDRPFRELKAAIRGRNPGRFYIFHGEETFLLRYYLDQLHDKCVDALTEAFNYHRFHNENFSVQAFADAVENLPMMAERTLVQVDDIDLFKLGESDRTRLVEVFSDIPDYCTVVLTYETLEWKPDKRQKKLWEAVEGHACVVEFYRQDPRELIPWITRHFAAQGKRISPELCNYLIGLTGGTMTALSGEIRKIVAYSGAETICKADIDAVTEPVLDAVVFQMTDLMGDGQFGRALEKLRQLFRMQQEPLAILGAVGTHFRRLSAAKILQNNGRGAEELMKLYSMWDSAARDTIRASRRFSDAFLDKAVTLVMETDRMIKTSVDDPERLLEILILTLAQEAKDG